MYSNLDLKNLTKIRARQKTFTNVFITVIASSDTRFIDFGCGQIFVMNDLYKIHLKRGYFELFRG